MSTYILKASLCAALLLVVYKWLFEGEKMLRFNRLYLLGALLFSCLVPGIQFRVTQEVLAVPLVQASDIALPTMLASPVGRAAQRSLDFETLLLSIYGMISLLL